MMNHPPPRTNTTFLTDDDLLIYDFLTLGRIPISAIRQIDYPFHMNCGYTHSLSDSQLVDRIHDLAQLRLLTYRRSEPRKRPRSSRQPNDQPPCTFRFPNAAVSFNIDGGELWEQERDPDWQRRIWWRPSPPGTMTVAALSKSIVSDYLQASHDTGRYTLQLPGAFEHHPEFELSVFYQNRTFRNVITATAVCQFPDSNILRKVWDTATYERNRTWWTDINAPPIARF